jgi:hypothetical protein
MEDTLNLKITNSGNLVYETRNIANSEFDQFPTALDSSFLNGLEMGNMEEETVFQPQVTSEILISDSPFNISARLVIHDVSENIRQISDRLSKLYHLQKQIPLPIRSEDFKALEKFHKETKSIIESSEIQLNKLIDSIILEPNEMNEIIILLDQLSLQMKQCDLFIQELNSFLTANVQPIVFLAITNQPFPSSIKQNKVMDQSVTVQLFTGSRTEPLGNSLVKAEIAHYPKSNNNSRTRGNAIRNQISVENSEKFMNGRTAIFNDLKFPNGTRKKAVTLKFVSTVTVRDHFGTTHTFLLESNPSKPLVVKTNENQWHEAEGTLLQESAFGSNSQISWQRFMNWLNRYYLMATRQNIQTPVRLLNPYDYEYFHQLKFDKMSMVTPKQFETFWLWLGPMLHKIRHQRHICTLWTKGYICGFLTKNEVESVLRNESIGTFLIRFSERVTTGAFVISYQAPDESGNPKVKHYLMQGDDTYAARKTLPDFLSEFKRLSCLLQLSYDPTTQRRTLRRCGKDTELGEFYSKRENIGQFPGYDDDIELWA